MPSARVFAWACRSTVVAGPFNLLTRVPLRSPCGYLVWGRGLRPLWVNQGSATPLVLLALLLFAVPSELTMGTLLVLPELEER